MKENKKNVGANLLEGEIKKNSLQVMLLSIFTAIVLICGVVFSYCSYKALSLKVKLAIIIDPVIITGTGENHLENAKIFNFDGGNREFNTHIETKLTHGQNLEYRFTFENSGETNVELKLSYKLDRQENISLNYEKNPSSLGDNEVYFAILKPGASVKVKVGVTIVDEGIDAYASGIFTFLLDDKGGER